MFLYQHASIACERKLDLVWVEASQLEDKDSEEYEAAWEIVRAADGIVVPGGFGNRCVLKNHFLCHSLQFYSF